MDEPSGVDVNSNDFSQNSTDTPFQLSGIFPRLKLRKCPETFVSPSGNIPAVNQKVHVLLRLCQDGRGCSEKLPNVKKLPQRKKN